MARTYRSDDGQQWKVTLEAPGKVMAVDPSLEKSGALLPEHAVYIVFTSGDQRYEEEYTELAALEDLSDGDLAEWYRAVRRGEGV